MNHILKFTLWGLVSTIFLWGNAVAQDSTHWDIRLNTGGTETIHDAFLLQDGRLVIVGETIRPGQGKQGLLVILDAASGTELLHRGDYGLANDDVFLSGAYAGDGTLYLCGYSQSRQYGEQGWLVRVDLESGDIISSDDKQGGKGNDRFEHIVWMDSGKGLIAGHSDGIGDGLIWMLQVDGNTITQQPSVGDGNIANLVGLEKGAGYVWLCGYTKPRGLARRGDVWLIKLNDKGDILYEKNVPKHPGQKVLGMTGTLDGELLLAGSIWNTNGDSDVWLGEISKQRQDSVKEAVFGMDSEDGSNALLKTPGGNRWLVVYRESSKSTIVQIYNNASDSSVKSLPYFNFKAIRLLWFSKNAYLMIGNVIGSKQSESSIRIVRLNGSEDLGFREDAAIEYTDLKLDDENHNEILEAGERAAIRFNLKNSSDGVIGDGKVKAKIVSAPAGVSLITSELLVNYLPSHSPIGYSIPIKSAPNTPTGKILIDIMVEVKGQVLLSFPVQLNDKQLPAGGPKTYIRTESGNPGTRVKVVDEKQQSVTVSGFTSNPDTKITDLVKVNNGKKVLEDDKSDVDFKLIPSTVKNERFEFTITYKIELDTGHNVFYVALDDERSEPIDFIYEPDKPNLHVLSIGVAYSDQTLKYTTKDARDFAMAMKAQSANGFFNTVKIDTLLTKEMTTTDEINGHFEELFNRYLQGNIKSKDYLVIFLSGHGVKRENNGKFGLKASNYNPDRKGTTTVDYNSLLDGYLNKINCKKIFFIDACHSGVSLIAGKEGPEDNTGRLLSEANATAAGAATFSSCMPNQTSLENSSWQNGAFTEALLEAFSGKPVTLQDGTILSADEGFLPENLKQKYANDKFVSLKELAIFLEKRVPDLVHRQFPAFDQNPLIDISNLKPELSFFKINKTP